MSKSEYVNRFNVFLNYASKEACIRFVNETPTYNDKNEQTGVDQNEVINIVLTEYNMRELHNILKELLYRMEQWQAAKDE